MMSPSQGRAAAFVCLRLDPLWFSSERSKSFQLFFSTLRTSVHLFQHVIQLGSPFGLACLGGAAPPYYRR